MRALKTRDKKRLKKLCKAVSVMLMIVIAFLAYIEFKIEPSIMDLTEIKAQTLATEAINTAVDRVIEELKFTYDELAEIRYTDSNTISSISTNTVNVNKLKSGVSLEVQNQLDKLQHKEFNYYLGDISGFELLNGMGPVLSVQLYFSSSIETEIINSLESAGINQTQSTLEIRVKAEVFLTSDEEYPNVVIETNVPVAQTLIVGELPTYMYRSW